MTNPPPKPTDPPGESFRTKAACLWPGLAMVAAFWLFRSIVASLELSVLLCYVLRIAGPVVLTAAFLLWWCTNRSIRSADRMRGLAFFVGGAVAASTFRHSSFPIQAPLIGGSPFAITFWTLWLFVVKKWPRASLQVGMFAAIGLSWGYMLLWRLDGVTGDLRAELRWRWTPSAEELFLAARTRPAPAATQERPLEATPEDWPGFRGANRDGLVRRLTVETNWSSAPPRLIWQRRVGPAWSSITVVAGRLLTQEQHGDRESLVCYDAATGQPIWSVENRARFSEAVSGPGPRATPTFAGGRIFALGATGVMTCADAASGELLWRRDVVRDAGAEIPPWGFCCSPLVVEGLVVIFAGGQAPNGLIAYHVATGNPAWIAAAGRSSCSSARFALVAGAAHILFLSERALNGIDPASGALLWEYPSPLFTTSEVRTLLPQLVESNQILIASEPDFGLALLEVDQHDRSWSVAERWVSRDLRSSFSDLVVWKGHVYGFDGRGLACIELKTGKRCWKGGRYGHGQVLLLVEQSLLVVTSESGEAALVTAGHERYQELGRYQAIRGKTWSHPAIARGRLYIRNAENMACYEIARGNMSEAEHKARSTSSDRLRGRQIAGRQ